MNSNWNYSRPFFWIGLSVAVFLSSLPYVLNLLSFSYDLDLLNLILFPTSLGLIYVENASPAGHVGIAILLMLLNGFVYGIVGLALDKVTPVIRASDGRRMPLVSILDLPLWRRIVLICALGIFALAVPTAIASDLMIYKSAPDHPVADTGQIYLVHVNHGFVRYVTLQEMEWLNFANDVTFRVAGPLFVLAVFLWITVPPPRTPLRS